VRAFTRAASDRRLLRAAGPAERVTAAGRCENEWADDTEPASIGHAIVSAIVD